MAPILALETSGRDFSIAIFAEGKIQDYLAVNEEQKQEQLLAPMVSEMLKRNRLTSFELSAIAVGSGPGSYTGLRIGMSFATGFSFASGIPVIPVGTLENIGFQLFEMHPESNFALASLLARKDETFLAIWKRNEIKPLLMPACYHSREIPESLASVSLEGILASNCQDAGIIEYLPDAVSIVSSTVKATAREVALLAAEKWKAGFISSAESLEPDYLKPVYISRKSA